ncbi:allatotropin-like isoform X1 [Choristoneura fumiferana]|uniref:allatotropin-like isoform X1 n=1 Tax=Choristoneura fumiferana TaxID=7141 RepID=UPI003D1571CC
MSITMQFLLVCVAACVCLSEGAADGRVARAKQQRPTRGFKNVEMMTARGFGKRDRPSTRTARDVGDQTPPERTSRGTPTFKSPSVGIGRYVGKRTPEMEPEEEKRVGRFKLNSGPLIAPNYGKRKMPTQRVYGLDNFWEMLESPEREGQDMNDDKTLESIPMDWFVNEMVNNPDFARSVVRKFVDINQDGMLSSDELLRNVV